MNSLADACGDAAFGSACWHDQISLAQSGQPISALLPMWPTGAVAAFTLTAGGHD
jgi:hypothetical protein